MSLGSRLASRLLTCIYSRKLVPFQSLRGYRSISSSTQTFSELCANPVSRYQIYVSQFYDPYVNLSIEHYLLQKTPKDSIVLLFYVNRPCVVIGRNQNPWLEANLKALRTKPVQQSGISPADNGGSGCPQLVRRRSGGGAVFHDGFNMNYTVICPTELFTRDKHVEMVVRALRTNNERVRVTERHDIVLDQGDLLPEMARPEVTDTHKTAYAQSSDHPPLKVSGSAYKLIRNRSLHHGTCLLNSPNLGLLSEYLRSPARPYLKARGVESVRSPVGNVYPLGMAGARESFQKNVMRSFAIMYGLDTKFMASFEDNEIKITPYSALSATGEGPFCVAGTIDEGIAEIPDIKSGVAELRSLDWIYTQSPRFSLSSHSIEEDDRDRPPLPPHLPPSTRILLRAHSGTIESTEISLSTDQSSATREIKDFNSILAGAKIHEISSFVTLFQDGIKEDDLRRRAKGVGKWLDEMFGIVHS
ncbi:MAG: Biotin/lipoate A/B protein ligase [Icmadophila ericetorum]|nr:Biotin/lipoate A/B protein ligase [Icmadophila ericetorum]